MTVDLRDLLGPRELADYLKVTPGTIYAWVSRGRLPAPDLALSGTNIWTRATIDAWRDALPRPIRRPSTD